MPQRLRIFETIVDFPRSTLLVALLIVAFFASYLPQLKFDASADALVLEGDSSLGYARQISERYATQDFLLVTYRPDADLFSDAVLQRLTALRDELAAVDAVSSVVSVLDVPLLYSPRISLSRISDDLPTLSDPAVDRALAAAEFRDSPIYRGLLTNADHSVTALQVNLQRDETYFALMSARDELRQQAREQRPTAEQRSALRAAERAFADYKLKVNARQERIVGEIRAILERYRDHAQIFLGGVPMIAVDLIAFMKSDLAVFGAGILAFIVVLLIVIFRSVRWVVMPLFICGATALGMLGWLGWLDWRLTVVSSNFAAILLIINLSILVHLVVRYRELAADDLQRPQRELVLGTLRSMARPCFYTSLTTLVAFASFVVSGIRPVIDFGWMMAIGVMVALVSSFVLFGAISMLLPRTGGSVVRSDKPLTRYFAMLTERFRGTILVAASFTALGAAWGVTQLEVENRFIDNFFEETEIYQGMETIDRELGGTIPLEVIIDADPRELAAAAPAEASEDDLFADDGNSQTASFWFTRRGLEQVSRVHDYLDALPETGKVISLATIFAVSKDLVGDNIDNVELALTKSGLPDSVSSVLVDPYLSEPNEQTRVALRVLETHRELRRDDLLKQIRTALVEGLGFAPEQVHLTGMLVLYNNMLQSLYRSQILSLGAVFVAIMAMFVLLFRSFKLAIIAMAPNLLGAGAILGVMGFTGIPLDMMTITIAAICIGIGVDDTIHYLHRFAEEFRLDGNYLAAMHRCHRSIGRAMYYTSMIIIFGFGILVLSNFRPSIYFGLLTGASMVAALIGNLLLLPALLLVARPFGPVRNPEAVPCNAA